MCDRQIWWLPWALLLAILLPNFACAPRTEANSPSSGVAGTWRWRCCTDGFHGTMQLHQDGSQIVGTFHDDVAGTGGSVAGKIDGERLEFTRSVGGGQQNFALTLSKDGSTGTGTISGSWISGMSDAHVERVK